jgi:hypothetical protein
MHDNIQENIHKLNNINNELSQKLLLKLQSIIILGQNNNTKADVAI